MYLFEDKALVVLVLRICDRKDVEAGSVEGIRRDIRGISADTIIRYYRSGVGKVRGSRPRMTGPGPSGELQLTVDGDSRTTGISAGIKKTPSRLFI